jgi:hypothetical protein
MPDLEVVVSSFCGLRTHFFDFVRLENMGLIILFAARFPSASHLHSWHDVRRKLTNGEIVIFIDLNFDAVLP